MTLLNVVALVVFVCCTACSDVSHAHLCIGAVVNFVCCTTCSYVAYLTLVLLGGTHWVGGLGAVSSIC